MQRLTAVNILKRVIKDKLTLKESFDVDEAFSLHQDKAFIAELCFGVCRYYPQLRQVLSVLVRSPLKAKDLDIEILLLIGFYQLKYTSVADYAAINETVETCKRLKKNWAKGLVNATLRAFMRQEKAIYQSLSENLGFQYALPDWYVRFFSSSSVALTSFGQALLERAPIYLRVNTKKISADDYVRLLKDDGVKIHRVSGLSECLQLENSLPIETLPGFEKGYVSVQDIAPQYANQLLQLASAKKVLDACSAPGGKLCHMLESIDESVDVTALDISASRVNRIKENLTRLGLSTRLVIGDGLEVGSVFVDETFDRIMLDAPCSASGVIRRHPDIKLLRTEADVYAIIKTQQALLESLWALLAEGGLLLYCTCSLFEIENDAQIGEFLKNHSDAKLQTISLPIGHETQYGIQCLPPEGDGFYYALLKKV